jgi:hypothetical protein
VFAGLRDDPFFNNVKGTRAAYQVAADALRRGVQLDAAGCPMFDRATSDAIFDQWRHTDGGPARNFLAGWAASALVISVNMDAVTKGGKLLAVWGATVGHDGQLNRAARPLTANALLGTVASQTLSNQLKEDYNAATPTDSGRFVAEIEKGLQLYDGFDGECGNQFLVDDKGDPAQRYRALARLLADDRIWINTESHTCTQLFAVELASLAGRKEESGDCGGRTPLYSAANVYRSLLVSGTTAGVDDGLTRDEHEPSATVFPFLAPPEEGKGQ